MIEYTGSWSASLIVWMKGGSEMDILTTVLAGIIVLSVPFLLLLQSKARTRYKRDLAEIKALTEERSEWLDKLHSRLDALNEQDAQRDQRELVLSREASFSTLRLFQRLLAYQTATGRDVASEITSDRHLVVLKTLDPEALRTITEYLRNDKIYGLYRPWLEEVTTDPEWLKDASFREPAATEDMRRKSGLRRVSRQSLQRPTPQPL